MDTFNSYVLFIIISLPLVGAVTIMAIPGYRSTEVRLTAAAFGFVTMLLTFYTSLVYYIDFRNMQGMHFTSG